MGRIERIKNLLKNNKLEPLIDFDNVQNIDTECFVPPKKTKNDDDSGESYDTRVVLNKKIYRFVDIICNIGQDELIYVKSGSTGHTFKACSNNEEPIEYAIKIVGYPKKKNYGDYTDIRRPENAELVVIKLLSYFVVKKHTPHIVLPIGMFDTDIIPFIKLKSMFKDDDKRNEDGTYNHKYLDFVDRYDKGQLHNKVSVLISEWANRGDLLEFIRTRYKKMSPIIWKVLFFQLLSVLSVIQYKYPSFRHNDLKANNILIHKTLDKNTNITNKFVTYHVDKIQYKVPDIGYQIKLWDFDFACIPGIADNIKVNQQWTRNINVRPIKNRYYDVHYFFNTLISKGFCRDMINSEYTPKEVRDFIYRIVPKKYRGCGGKDGDSRYVHERGRILVNDEYTTPNEILKNDPYFKEFRCDSNKKIDSKIIKHLSVNNNSNNPNSSNSSDNSDEGMDIDIKEMIYNKSKSNNKTRVKIKSKRIKRTISPSSSCDSN